MPDLPPAIVDLLRSRRLERVPVNTEYARDVLAMAELHTGVAARALLAHPAVGEFEWMRQVRNATEYPSEDRAGASRQDVDEGIAAAAAIVAACGTHHLEDLAGIVGVLAWPGVAAVDHGDRGTSTPRWLAWPAPWSGMVPPPDGTIFLGR